MIIGQYIYLPFIGSESDSKPLYILIGKRTQINTRIKTNTITSILRTYFKNTFSIHYWMPLE